MTAHRDITVLLPVYNAEQFIAESVTSILQQTYRYFTLLIIDDGSTDRTGTILEELAAQDLRIELYRRENRGLVATLNEGLALCRTELIVRMDADDIAMPERLAIQKAYMDAHPEIAVCGSSIIIHEYDKVYDFPEKTAFDVQSLFHSPLAHPSVIFRKSIIMRVGGYDINMPAAEDYDLWVRLLSAGFHIANIPAPLLRYRIHPYDARIRYRITAEQTTNKIWQCQLSKLGIKMNLKDIDIHRYCSYPCQDTRSHQKKAIKWLEKICAANKSFKVYNQKELEEFCNSIRNSFPPPVDWKKNPRKWIFRQGCHVGFAFFCLFGPWGVMFFQKIKKVIRNYK